MTVQSIADALAGMYEEGVKAERERCAKIAESEKLFHIRDEYPSAEDACDRIAEIIRSGQ